MAEVAKNSMENTENESKYANQSDKGGDGNTLSDNQKEKELKWLPRGSGFWSC